MTESQNDEQPKALRQIAIDAPKYSGYQPLNQAERQIRLLDLRQGLKCALRIVSLDEKPVYCALSYCWGPPGATLKPITVEGEVIHIRRTLYKFLKSLLKKFGPLTVWLDVLCINQRDLVEQSAQVTMMGEIYASAKCVYAWLGQGGPETDYTMDYVMATANSTNGGDKYHLSSYDIPTVQVGLWPIMSQDYWSRVWIFQECTLNTDTLMVCGDKVVSLDCLLKLTLGFSAETRPHGKRAYPDPEVAPSLLNRLKLLASVREAFANGQTKSLFELAHESTLLSCGDVQDHIYGLRALSSDGHRLRVDYSRGIFDAIMRLVSMHNWSSFEQLCGTEGETCSCDEPSGRISRHAPTRRIEQPACFYRWWMLHYSGCPQTLPLLRQTFEISSLLQLTQEDVCTALSDHSEDWLAIPITFLRKEVALADVRMTVDVVSMNYLGNGPTTSVPDEVQLEAQMKAMSSQLGDVEGIMDGLECLDKPTLTRLMFPGYDKGANIRYFKADDSLKVVVDMVSGKLVNAWSTKLCGNFFQSANFRRLGQGWTIQTRPRQLCSLFITASNMLPNHIWTCYVTRAVHISRFGLLMLKWLGEAYGGNAQEVEALLRQYDTSKTNGGPVGKCTCVMPEGLPARHKSPWGQHYVAPGVADKSAPIAGPMTVQVSLQEPTHHGSLQPNSGSHHVSHKNHQSRSNERPLLETSYLSDPA